MMNSNRSSIPTKAPRNHIVPSTSSFHWNQSVDAASCRDIYNVLCYITSASRPAALHPASLKVPSEPRRAHALSSIQPHAVSSFVMADPTLLCRPLVRHDEPKPPARTQGTSERERAPQYKQPSNGRQGWMAHRTVRQAHSCCGRAELSHTEALRTMRSSPRSWGGCS